MVCFLKISYKEALNEAVKTSFPSSKIRFSEHKGPIFISLTLLDRFTRLILYENFKTVSATLGQLFLTVINVVRIMPIQMMICDS